LQNLILFGPHTSAPKGQRVKIWKKAVESAHGNQPTVTQVKEAMGQKCLPGETVGRTRIQIEQWLREQFIAWDLDARQKGINPGNYYECSKWLAEKLFSWLKNAP